MVTAGLGLIWLENPGKRWVGMGPECTVVWRVLGQFDRG